jgi:hypothetical protein
MKAPVQHAVSNGLLAALPPGNHAQLAPALTTVDLP